jgi:hypothetical protein
LLVLLAVSRSGWQVSAPFAASQDASERVARYAIAKISSGDATRFDACRPETIGPAKIRTHTPW